jgi:hypothetical protein
MRLLFFVVLLLFAVRVFADDLPCLGNKGGIEHCDNRAFVCHNGDVEKYATLDCSTVFYQHGDGDIAGDTNHDGVLSASEQYFFKTEAAENQHSPEYYEENSEYLSDSYGGSGSTVHTGRRGGRYTITSGGNKHYLPRR